MNPVTGLNILKAALAAALRDPGVPNPQDLGLMRQYIAHAIPEAWTYAPWPSLMTLAEAEVEEGQVTKGATWGQINAVYSADFRSDPAAALVPYHDESSLISLLPPANIEQASVWVEVWDPEPELLPLSDTEFAAYEFPGEIATALSLIAAGHLLRASSKVDVGDELLALAQSNLQTRAQPVLLERSQGVDRHIRRARI